MNDESVSSSAEKDIRAGIKFGKDTARTAKTVSKAASQAAAGNVAGAAATVLKDPETAKKIAIAALAPIILVLSLVLFSLYSLPTAIYESVNSYFDEAEEQWNERVYGSDDGVVWSGIWASVSTVGDFIGDTAKALWNGIASLLTGEGGSSNYSDGAESLTPNGVELHVAQSESAAKEVLNNKIKACVTKLNKRCDDISSAINAQRSEIEEYFSSKYEGLYDEWRGTTINIYKNNISRNDAIKLLSAYTVMEDASLENVKAASFMKWLGYYNEFESKTMSFSIGGSSDIYGTVKAWRGTFLPQYLLEQKKYEKYKYGQEVTDFSSKTCAAVDLLLIVDCPDFASVEPTVTYETREGPVPGEAEVVSVAMVNLQITIKARPSDEFASKIIGFTDGEEQKTNY